MKVVALALALSFAAVPVQAAVKTPVVQGHRPIKRQKVKARSHVKKAAKAAHLKKLNRAKVN